MTRHRVDSRDIAILAVLSREGRISKADLARRVNLSPPPLAVLLEADGLS